MKRRDFVIALGAGAGASIFGFFEWKALKKTGSRPKDRPAAVDFKPRLKDGIVFGWADDGLATLRLPGAKETALCAVNETGAAILRMLDGRRGVEDIAQAVAQEYNLVRTDSLDAKIAYFLTQVSQLGFLRNPFYACIVDVAGA